ncbi:MAG TPA: replication-relaxation family protein [Methylocella sp.]|jgi:hypothetical protein
MEAVAEKKRRSHLNRRAMPKGVQITDNDIRDIFEPLSRHAQLTTRQLVAFGARNPIITKARLGELWHGTEGQRSHWLHRLNEDVLFANHLYVEDMHRIGDEGEALLRAKGVIPSEDWVANSRIGGKSTAPSRIIRLAHDHMASDITLDIEIGARAAGVSFKNHINILQAAPGATRLQKTPLKIPVHINGDRTFVEPDALFSIGRRHYALEADKGTESIKAVIVQKILAYREIVAAGIIDDYLGIDNLTVLFATTNVTRMQNIMDELARIARNGRSTMFAFRAEAGFGDFLRTPPPSGHLVTSPGIALATII